MSILYTRWPQQFAERYRKKGYWLDLPLTELLTHHADSDATAIIEGERHISYRQLNQLIDNFAAYMQHQGIKCGETALIQLGNIAEFYITLFALLRIGVAPVSALFSHQRSELNAYTQQVQPAVMIADRQHTLFSDDNFLNDFLAKYSSIRLVLLNHDHKNYDLQSAMTQQNPPLIPMSTRADEVALFQLSGGSTGTPKLIPRTHNDYAYSIRRSHEICYFNAQTRYLCALPSAHNYTLSSPGALGTFMAKGCVILAENPSPERCFSLIEQHNVNVTSLVPSAVGLWLQALREWNCYSKLASLALMQVGGAPLAPSLAVRITTEIGCQLQQVFGMAEGLVNCTRLDDPLERVMNTQGYPICPDDEVWVADEQGEPLPNGEIERLMVRGPYTIRGYYCSPTYDTETFDKNGFYNSGDLVSIDQTGYITVHGREKDQINRGGEKIAAQEIENLLLQHEAIIYAALVSVEDPLLGEKSCAYLVSTIPLSTVVVRRFLNQQGVAQYKLPDRVKCVNALPLTHVGKVDKKRLREWLMNQS